MGGRDTLQKELFFLISEETDQPWVGVGWRKVVGTWGRKFRGASLGKVGSACDSRVQDAIHSSHFHTLRSQPESQDLF